MRVILYGTPAQLFSTSCFPIETRLYSTATNISVCINNCFPFYINLAWDHWLSVHFLLHVALSDGQISKSPQVAEMSCDVVASICLWTDIHNLVCKWLKGTKYFEIIPMSTASIKVCHLWPVLQLTGSDCPSSCLTTLWKGFLQRQTFLLKSKIFPVLTQTSNTLPSNSNK